MKNFFKPTKVMWWMFGIFVLVMHVPILVTILWYQIRPPSTDIPDIPSYLLPEGSDHSFKFFVTKTLTAPFRLLTESIVDFLEPVIDFSSFFDSLVPTFIILEFIVFILVIGLQLTLMYFIASIISKIWYMFKNKKANEASEAIS